VTIDLAEPSTAIWRVTGVLFRAAARDPDGDPLVYTWDFGDGETVQGDGVIAHAFDKSGGIDVTLTVDDKRGGTATARRTINVVRMSGRWFGLLTNGPHSGLRIGGDVAQAGRSFATNMSTVWGDGAGGSGSFEVSGVFFDPQDMTFRIAGFCGGDVTYRGSWNDRLDTFSGDGSGCGVDYHHIDLYR
jgi:PKD repeat protein